MIRRTDEPSIKSDFFYNRKIEALSANDSKTRPYGMQGGSTVSKWTPTWSPSSGFGSAGYFFEPSVRNRLTHFDDRSWPFSEKPVPENRPKVRFLRALSSAEP